MLLLGLPVAPTALGGNFLLHPPRVPVKIVLRDLTLKLWVNGVVCSVPRGSTPRLLAPSRAVTVPSEPSAERTPTVVVIAHPVAMQVAPGLS